MPFLKTTSEPSTEIYYEDTGGKGKTIVLIHGWPLSQRMWESQINVLREAGFRCISYDRRGFGNSGKPAGGYDYDTFTSDLHDLLVTLDLQDVTLAGFSMGGGEVARYFGLYNGERVSKVMMLGAVPPFLMKTADNPEGVDKSVFDGLLDGAKKDRVNFFAGFFKKFFNLDKHKHAISEDMLLATKTIAWGASPLATQECIKAFGFTDFRTDLAKIKVPTLVAHGDSDQIVPFEVSGKRTAAMIAGSRLEVFKDAPHGFAATHGEQLSDLMVEFMKS